MITFMKRLERLEKRLAAADPSFWWILSDGTEVPETPELEPLQILLNGCDSGFCPVSFRYEGEADPFTLSLYAGALEETKKGVQLMRQADAQIDRLAEVIRRGGTDQVILVYASGEEKRLPACAALCALLGSCGQVVDVRPALHHSAGML